MKTLNLKYFGVTILIFRGYVTSSERDYIGLGVGTFLLVVNDDHAPILHGYGDTGLQRFRGHEFDLLGSRDVIGHVTNRLGVCGFLFVVHCNHASNLHRYGDINLKIAFAHVKGQKFTAHAPCPVICRQGVQNDLE